MSENFSQRKAMADGKSLHSTEQSPSLGLALKFLPFDAIPNGKEQCIPVPTLFPVGDSNGV